MTTRATSLVILAGIIVISGALILGIILPVWSQVLAAQAATAQANTTANDLEAERENLKKIAADKDTNQVLSDRLADLLPKNPAIDQLIVSFEQLGEALGVRLVVLSAKTSAAAASDTTFATLPAGFETVRFSLELTGPYLPIQSFIHQLTVLDRLVDVGTLNLTAVADGSISAHLEIRAFYKPKTTVQESSQTLTINPTLRAALLAPRNLMPLANLPAGDTGRGDPFAPVP